MITRAKAAIGLVLAVISASPITGDSPHIRIVSPTEGAVVIGPTRLRAEVEPPSLASSVAFFVDGGQVCTGAKPPFECEWDAGSSIVPHQVRLVVNLVTGGRIVQTVRTLGITFAETVDVDVVQVTTTVMDDSGRYVKGLPRSAFHVTEDGRSQTVSHFYTDEAPLELVVAVDVSGSMKPALPVMKQAIAAFLDAIPSHHRVTLLGFNSEVFTLASRTATRDERRKVVDGLAAWGSTALYETIVRGVEILGAQPGRKALIVFTDGEDQGSHITVAEAEAALQSSDLVLYMIGQGEGITREPLKKLMERLARPTGGRAISTNSIDQLQDSFTELLEELSNQYVLGYEPRTAVRDGTWRQVQVKVDGYHRIRARHGYRAAARHESTK